MSIRWSAAFFAGLALWASSGPAAARQGPSFSCEGRLKVPEQLICADDELAEMDLKMSDLFHEAGGPKHSPYRVHTYIRESLAIRNQCRTARCVRNLLTDEINYLERYLDGNE